jgi:hypothetical protein
MSALGYWRHFTSKPGFTVLANLWLERHILEDRQEEDYEEGASAC